MLATPYRFSPDAIRQIIPEGCIGVYALGDIENGVFSIKYVGRSDCSLRRRLLTHNLLYKYPYFIFAIVDTVKAGFELESRWWHDCKIARLALINRIHPDARSGERTKCPYCEFSDNIRKFLREEVTGFVWPNAS